MIKLEYRSYYELPTDQMMDITEMLEDDEIGRLFTCATHYARTGEEIELPGMERYFWKLVKRFVDESMQEERNGTEEND